MPLPLAPLRCLFALPLASEAEYRPLSGAAPYPLRVMHAVPIEEFQFGGGGGVVSRGNVVHAMVEELQAPPVEGDRIWMVEEGVLLQVQGKPVHGVRGQVWEIDTFEVGS